MALGGYSDAMKLGKRAVWRAELAGRSPYLPVLDGFLTSREIAGEFPLGTMDIPVSMIAGNKTESRNNSFALNWMPVMGEKTEFAFKWDNLYNSCAQEGVHDAIECYEYLNHYYVQEGNKRVSVSKYLGIDYIPARVTRILPVRTGERNIQVYYEFHDFSRRSHIYDIIMNEKGQYETLSEMYGQTITEEWPEEATMNLNSAWHQFVRAYEKLDKQGDESTLGPAFLAYLNIFKPSSMESDSVDQIVSNIRSAREALERASADVEYSFIEDEGQNAQETSGFMKFFQNLKYSKYSPLKFALVYGADIEHSRWSDTHEAGLLYVEQMLGENVAGSSYIIPDEEEGLEKTLNKAVQDDNKVIFTITPGMAEETERAAIKYPHVHFLNCSLAMNMETIRCYDARMYEATFLMGILAASALQRMNLPVESQVIGYMADAPTKTTLASVNAFAIGASLINPSCRISLGWAACEKDKNKREEWEKEGVRVFSDASSENENEPEVFSRLYYVDDSGKTVYLGTPFYSWGRYYTRIIKSVMEGSFDALALKKEKTATSFWFGLSSGVVDIRLGKDVPEQTRKLLSMFKNAIIEDSISPFSGLIRTTDMRVINPDEGKPQELRARMDKLSLPEIASISWLNENIDGKIPDMSELTDAGKRLVKAMGV